MGLSIGLMSTILAESERLVHEEALSLMVSNLYALSPVP